MEIREVTQYHKDAPFAGYGIWIVFELKYRKTQIIHPIHFTELILSEYEILRASGNSLWPVNKTKSSFNIERFREDFKERIKLNIRQRKPFNVQNIAKVLAELEDIPIEKALSYIGSLAEHEPGKPIPKVLDKGSSIYALRQDADLSNFKGRPLAVVNAFKENGPSSIYQINHLVTGRMKTRMNVDRVVTFIVHKLRSQGILEIVA